MIRKVLIPFAVALAVLPGPLVAQGAPAPGDSAIDTMAVRAWTYFLAHDLLEGRGTGRRGSDVAAAYLASEAERLGLEPAGDGHGFLQRVPLVEAEIVAAGTTIDVATRDSAAGPESHATFGYLTGFIPNVGTARTLVSFHGTAAWVGAARDVLEHPERLPALAGTVALMSGVFGADAAAADTLRARGVVGVIHILPDAPLYRLYVDSRGPSRMYVDDPGVTSSFIPDIPAVIASPTLMHTLLPWVANAGGANGPVALPNLAIDVRIQTRPRRLASHNVAAILPGADPALRGQYVVYTAHLDHLGVGARDQAGDSIFNGFSDNAAGAAMLLAIAKAMQQLPAPERPARSVLFLWPTGEELGLLGSDWYVAHPTVATDSIAGVICLDAGAPPARSVDWRVAGGARSTLGDTALAVGRQAGWNVQATPASPNTDYFPFLRTGVPAVFLVPGPAAYEGLTLDSSQALRLKWDHYHQQADNWHADFPFSGIARYADFGLRLGLAAARGPRPVLTTCAGCRAAARTGAGPSRDRER